MKRKWQGEETPTAVPTSSSHGGESGTGYDVFLSFRGPDTRLTIVDSLYNDMIRAGIRPFKDNEELRFGEKIEGGLLQAIKDSKIYIPIFSKDYASSKWCLRELTHIVESSRENHEKVILPIFYDVDADDVKLKTELYRKALRKHKSDSGKDLAKKWKRALREVATIKGRNLKDHGLYKLVNLMVEEVSTLLWTRQTDMPDHLVGIQDRMDEIMKQLDLGAFGVQFIVIHGMGGIGKTTLAKAVFRKISPQFLGQCCFLKDVRTCEIINLQKKLLSDILKLNYTNVSFIDEGADLIKTKFHGKKVLIVLDDIDNLNQIERLAGEPNWFGGGSRIIITTRNIEFLVNEGKDDNVSASNNRHFSFYDMPEMNWDDALQLFCGRCLGCAKPPPDYMDISGDIINALGRLPLALVVIGSTLHGKHRSTWEGVLQKLKKVMNEDVKKKLIISYEALDSCQKQIYLDIACFFINQEITTAIKYWDAVFGYPTENDVKFLTHMSLIKIVDKDKLWMHDQLRDLGRDIVHPKSGENNQMGSRLWSPKDAFPVVQSKRGTEKIVALNLGTPESDATYKFKRKQFASLVKLQFLELDHGNFEGDFKDIFSELRWLSWSNCPSEFQATNFGLKNLAILILSGENITEDWGGWCQIMVAKQLKVLKLMDCPSLRKTPEFSTISGLERLILRGCTQLRKIDKSIGNLQHLDYLEIESKRLLVLPRSTGNLVKVKQLILRCSTILGWERLIPEECTGLRKIGKSISNLQNLDHLQIQSGRILELPHSIGNLVKVKHLILRCPKLQKLPESIGHLESLFELDIQYSKIRELPRSIGNAARLEVLRITNCKLKKLPDSIGRLQSLLELDLYGTKVKSLPNCIGYLKKLKVLNLNCTRISKLPKTIGMVENLEELSAFECGIGEIPIEIGALSSLRVLDLTWGRFSRLPTTVNQLTNLQELNLSDCDWIQQLPELPMSVMCLRFSLKSMTTISNLSNLTNLVDLDISVADGGRPVQKPNIKWLGRLRALRVLRLVVKDMTLPPTDLSSLSQLQELIITCIDPQSLSRLPSSLQYLNLRDVQSPIDWSVFSNLENLSTLILLGYGLGEIRFDALGKLGNLNRLRICRSQLLRTLSGLSCLKEIWILEVNDLPQLTEIPELGELKSLRELLIDNCNSIKRLTKTDLSNLQNLRYLWFTNCGSLESVPDLPYTKTSCHLSIEDCQRLPDYNGPYWFYRDG